MSDAVFIVGSVSGRLAIGDKHELDKAAWLSREVCGLRRPLAIFAMGSSTRTNLITSRYRSSVATPAAG